ncbi:MAG: hypothetical protein HA496_02745 [Thaumarchaeota archaeon]|nr:hypothetical protein [Nitrososphaerota archaeon]
MTVFVRQKNSCNTQPRLENSRMKTASRKRRAIEKEARKTFFKVILTAASCLTVSPACTSPP